ncbi:MAG: flavodoxin domain-containing protein [Clostridiales bacterium]|nr:flavodoxin domain-containing protein [Clostridiales bacterium]MDD7346945.1 flavodoxin domain-containing protein [Clostridiales bacterium]MDY4061208.1 flavodoxin domain-containing protein [Anaerovoracaceae bacterium]
MKNIAIVYWSGTGNTKIMAESIQEGAGESAKLFTAEEFTPEMVDEYDVLAFGCPSMGAEELEEDVFRPLWDDVLPKLNGKSVALFGSYGWGDGEWMRLWEEEANDAGIELAQPCLIVHETPDEEGMDECRSLGQNLAF